MIWCKKAYKESFELITIYQKLYLRLNPANPNRAEPNNHAAAGRGIAYVLPYLAEIMGS